MYPIPTTPKFISSGEPFTPFPSSRSTNWNRTGSAKFNREVLRISKEQNQLEKNYKQSLRKLKAAQKGVISLLGKDMYPDLNPDTALFEYNDPGFCYRRNGEPRRRFLLAESKTRKIIHDMEGKEGILSGPASNVLSDNPILSELLSSPEIVSILCDLRTTSAILDDPYLYRQFENAMLNNPPNPLPFKGSGEDSMRCLRRYRTNLIHEFFEALSLQTHLRLSGGMVDKNAFKHILGLETAEGSQDRLVDSYNSTMTEKEWTETLLDRLKEIAAANEENISKDTSSTSIITQSIESPVPTKKADTKKSARNPVVTIAPVVPENTGNLGADSGNRSQGNSTPKPVPQSRIKRRKKKSFETKKKQYQKEFDKFVKSLISEVENVREVDKSMHALRRKNPTRRLTETEPLLKILEKDTLFESLNTTKLHGGIDYKYPEPDKLQMYLADPLIIKKKSAGPEIEMLNKHISSTFLMAKPRNQTHSQLPPSLSDTNFVLKQRNIKNSLSFRINEKYGNGRTRTLFSLKSSLNSMPLKSVNRVCCEACRAKMKQVCNQFRERDIKSKSQYESIPWKTPGNSYKWTKNYTPGNIGVKQNLLAGLPVILRKTYNSFTPKQIPMSSTANLEQFPIRLGSQNDMLFPKFKYDSPNFQTPKVLQSNQILTYQKLNLPSYYFESVVEPGKEDVNMNLNSISSQGTPIIEDSPKSFISTPIHFGKKRRIPKTKTSIYKNHRISNTLKLHSGHSGSPNSWTLKVSTMDIVKLRHELDLESVRLKIENFTNEINNDDTIPILHI